jgi:hypothetical protein
VTATQPARRVPLTPAATLHLQARCLRNAAHLAGDRRERRRLRTEAARVAAGQGVLTPTTEES